MTSWRIEQVRNCDGFGCCSHQGLFSPQGGMNPPEKCRFWIEDNKGKHEKGCMLMAGTANPKLLSAAERRAFNDFCISWPDRLVDWQKVFTSGERAAMRKLGIGISVDCCWQWTSMD